MTTNRPNRAMNSRKEPMGSHDYYATDPIAIDKLFEVEEFSQNIWECACGEGHLSKRMIEFGKDVYSTDLIYRGFGRGGVDFLFELEDFEGDIITNPPYNMAKEFVERALILSDRKVAMFLKLTFLESKGRREMLENTPLKYVYVFSERINCAKGGKFEDFPSSAVAYAWFVWDKEYEGEPIIRWL